MENEERAHYVFSSHPERQLSKWARALRHLRFCRAFGGHANDGDTFQCSIPYKSEGDLLQMCERLSLRLQPRRPDQRNSDNAIEEFPHYKQPGHCQLFGVPAFVWIGRGIVHIGLSGADGDPYEVTSADFENAQKLDAELARAGLTFCDPPVDSSHCICPKYWPEVFTYNTPSQDK